MLCSEVRALENLLCLLVDCDNMLGPCSDRTLPKMQEAQAFVLVIRPEVLDLLQRLSFEVFCEFLWLVSVSLYKLDVPVAILWQPDGARLHLAPGFNLQGR